VLTVLMGLAYWGNIVAADARNGGGSSGGPMGTFFLIWTVAWALMYACVIPGKGVLDKGPVLAVIYTVIVALASCLFLRLNDHGWESNRLLAIGDDAECLGRNLARAEKNHQVDGRQRSQRHTDARQGKISGPAGLSHFAGELCAVVPHAVLDGGRKSLSDVWEVEEERLPQRTQREHKGTQGKTDSLCVPQCTSVPPVVKI
jgi:hypothetical protein